MILILIVTVFTSYSYAPLEKVNISYLIIFSAFEYFVVCFSLEMVKRCDGHVVVTLCGVDGVGTNISSNAAWYVPLPKPN